MLVSITTNNAQDNNILELNTALSAQIYKDNAQLENSKSYTNHKSIY